MSTSLEAPTTTEDEQSLLTRSGANAAVLESVRQQWRRKRRRQLIVVRGVQVIAVVAFLSGWQWLGSRSKAWLIEVSRPTDVLSALWAWLREASQWHALWVTVQQAVLGFLLGAGAAVLLATALSLSPFLTKFVTPFVTALQSVPKLALVPLFIVVFGASSMEGIYFVSSIGFFIVFWNIYLGLIGLDPVVLISARVLGASRWWLLREVYVPSMAGWFITSLRLGLSWSLLGAVVSELLAGEIGIGAVIRVAEDNLQTADVLAGIFVVALVALIFDRVFVRFQRRVSLWRLT